MMTGGAAWWRGQSFDEAAIYPGAYWHKALTNEISKGWAELLDSLGGALKTEVCSDV